MGESGADNGGVRGRNHPELRVGMQRLEGEGGGLGHKCCSSVCLNSLDTRWVLFVVLEQNQLPVNPKRFSEVNRKAFRL